ncbi:hypothetical protein [uncultured Rothia sp.]|uniref:hypothetical protein n=1 Tax=uncultured Rothia sp. TaxID=316088 RepID=UPI00261DC669|nr:hypothetical protein [uncultured Rothia sp.]
MNNEITFTEDTLAADPTVSFFSAPLPQHVQEEVKLAQEKQKRRKMAQQASQQVAEAIKAQTDLETAAATQMAMRQVDEELAEAAQEETPRKRYERKITVGVDAMPIRNGVRHPRPGTKAYVFWKLYTELSKEQRSPVAFGDARPHIDNLGMNLNSARLEYAEWRKFFGVSGRVYTKEQIARRAAYPEGK